MKCLILLFLCTALFFATIVVADESLSESEDATEKIDESKKDEVSEEKEEDLGKVINLVDKDWIK